MWPMSYWGGALSRNSFKISRNGYNTLFVISILSLALRYILLYNSYERNPLIMTYNGVWAYFPAIFIFLFAKNNLGYVKDNIAAKLKTISSYSFGVYLIHGFVMYFVTRLVSDSSVFHSIVVAPMTYVICILIVATLKRFKFTRWMMG